MMLRFNSGEDEVEDGVRVSMKVIDNDIILVIKSYKYYVI